MIKLTKRIEERGLSRAVAAKLLGVRRSTVGDLVGGRIDRFSADALIEMMRRAGATGSPS